MSKLNKILIIPVVLCGILLNVALADKTDCEIFGEKSYKLWDGFKNIEGSRLTDSNYYSKFLTIDQQKAIMDKESLNTAMLNLKKYCCENGLGGLSMEYEICSKDKEFFNDNVIDSPYLFDHLFDVEMRRLGGLTGAYDIYTNTEMKSDEKALEWRAWITSQAVNVSGANPQVIIDKYKEFWQPSPPGLGYDLNKSVGTVFLNKSTDDFLKYIIGEGGTSESESVAEALKNYNSWTLYDRYNNACVITEYFYALLSYPEVSDDKQEIVHKLARGACKQIVENQINSEELYVQLVIPQAGNLFLKNYRQGYLSYLYGRAQHLQKTWSDAADKFLDVVRGVPHLVKTCMK